MSRENVTEIPEFESKFNAKFSTANTFTRFIAVMFFKISTKFRKLLRIIKITSKTSINESTKPQPSKTSVKKPMILSQVGQHITIEDVLHSDVQLAISSKPVHVKFYNYQTDPDTFFKYVDADLKTLKELKR